MERIATAATTANEFGKDIRRWLDNEPVTAVKPSVGYVFYNSPVAKVAWPPPPASCCC